MSAFRTLLRRGTDAAVGAAPPRFPVRDLRRSGVRRGGGSRGGEAGMWPRPRGGVVRTEGAGRSYGRGGSGFVRWSGPGVYGGNGPGVYGGGEGIGPFGP
ncbi:hypothetical protein GCM10010305_24390 [Streptomyces termitum]|uniref:Uncharacterized protein n=1 Tax=Streptomyces termitum TaxID=67368 RepID=A0A918T2G2_9ACTN|nr:hypothetical protein GCM10010305_24390 [Streptomyces termitum]